MNPASSKNEETIFAEALSLPAVERAAYLDQATEGRPEVRRRVEALLGSYRSGEFLEQAAAEGIRPTVTLTEKAGDTLGRYKLLEQIGEGGCGVVYVAEQSEPVRRRVALKIIKLGMDTRSIIARFEAERQALAMMAHPNIAKVFDAGATETGRPYFVMELVRGMKITEFCDEAKLSTRARLDLFIQVCQAIQHAHQKGIIHRDIKPSNILVTVNDGIAVPKVIDFGIAKATSGQQLTDKTIYTAFEQFIGTPAYMSPEQAVLTSLDIDTRSDIYALGVLLYELLTGKTPFDAKELLAVGLDEMRRTIREQEPQRPSTRLSTLPGQELSTTAQRRGLDAPKLVSELRGDLDWIVMKCIEKDRARRYETANGLAVDVQRHLNNEPVVACPPRRLYRLQKAVRRNKLAFAAAAAVVGALVIGLGISTWMFLRERQAYERAVIAEDQASQARANESVLRQTAEVEEKKARVEARKSQQVSRFLEDMLKGVGPSVALGRDTKMLREILDNTAERVTKDLSDEPDVEAEMLNDIGEVYRALGQYEKAEQMHRQALAIYITLRGREHIDIARSLHNLGNAISAEGQLAGAEEAHRDALRIRRKLLGEEHIDVADSMNALGNVRLSRGDIFEAEALLLQALTMKRKLLVADHSSIAATLGDLARLHQRRGKFSEAEPLLREALAIQTKVWGEDDLRVAALLGNLATILASQDNLPAAETMQREALARHRKLFGKEHPRVARSLGELAGILQRAGKLDDVEALFREEIANALERYPANTAPRSDGIYSLLDVLLLQKEFTNTEQLIFKLLTPALGAQPRNVRLLFDRAQFFARRSRWKEAAADFSRIKEIDPAHENHSAELAFSLVECGELDAFQKHCRETLTRVGDSKDPILAERTARFCLLLAPANEDQLEAAARLAENAVTYGANHPFLPYFQLAKGLADYRKGRFKEAEEWVQKSLAHRWTDANLNAPARLILAMTLHQLGRAEEARTELTRAVTFVHQSWPYSTSGDLRKGWNDLLTAHIFLREATALIEGSSETRAEMK